MDSPSVDDKCASLVDFSQFSFVFFVILPMVSTQSLVRSLLPRNDGFVLLDAVHNNKIGNSKIDNQFHVNTINNQ